MPPCCLFVVMHNLWKCPILWHALHLALKVAIVIKIHYLYLKTHNFTVIVQIHETTNYIQNRVKSFVILKWSGLWGH